MANFKLSKKAKNDIINIWEYTFNNWSKQQADNYYDLILNEIEHLEKNPYSGRNYSNLRKNYLGSIVKSHIIFYLITDESEIEIVRILHSKMDLARRLNQ